MAIRSIINRVTGAARATQFKKSAKTSANVFTSNRNFMRRKSTGGQGG